MSIIHDINGAEEIFKEKIKNRIEHLWNILYKFDQERVIQRADWIRTRWTVNEQLDTYYK